MLNRQQYLFVLWLHFPYCSSCLVNIFPCTSTLILRIALSHQIFHESCFKIVDPQAEKEDGDVLRFGEEISLVDDRGMVWNNKDGRLHGRLGPSLFGEGRISRLLEYLTLSQVISEIAFSTAVNSAIDTVLNLDRYCSTVVPPDKSLAYLFGDIPNLCSQRLSPLEMTDLEVAVAGGTQ